MTKRVDMGVFCELSKQPLSHRVGEFAGIHNMLELGTPAQMVIAAECAIGQRLRYKDRVG